MVKMRIYFIPKDYVDVICDGVEVRFAEKTCIVQGGPNNGQTWSNCKGVRIIDEHPYVQCNLFEEA